MTTAEHQPVTIDPATFVEFRRVEPIITGKGYEIYFDALTLDGDPGTGKTTIGKAFAEKLGLTYHKPSAAQRDYHREKTGQETIGAHKRPISVDKSVDEEVTKLILEKKGNIVEGHLANIIAIRVLPYTTVRVRTFTQNPNTSTTRAMNRDNKAIRRNNLKRVKEGLRPFPELTFEQYRKRLRARMSLNRKIWSPSYQDYPDAYDTYNGSANLIVDTEYMNPDESVDGLISYLDNLGLVKKIEPTSLPKDGQVFPAPAA